MLRTVRPMEPAEAPAIVDYFLQADLEFLNQLGVEPSKLPERIDWINRLNDEFSRPLERKRFFYLVWEADRLPIGHSNINKISFGQQAFMHLHIWRPEHRRSGHAAHYVQQSVQEFFRLFQLRRLYCEPYALNEAPNRTLPKAGFRFVKKYETTPGWLNFHQPVNLWVLERASALGK